MTLLSHLDRLKEIAGRATLGPWRTYHDSVISENPEAAPGDIICYQPPEAWPSSRERFDANATHIAAFSPAVAQAMVEVCRAAYKARLEFEAFGRPGSSATVAIMDALANLENVLGNG